MSTQGRVRRELGQALDLDRGWRGRRAPHLDLLRWWKVTALGFSVNASGWDTGALGKLVFFVALIAIALVIVDHMKIDISRLPVPVPLACSAPARSRCCSSSSASSTRPDGVDWAWGIYVALIAALVLTYGAWLKVQEDARHVARAGRVRGHAAAARPSRRA